VTTKAKTASKAKAKKASGAATTARRAGKATKAKPQPVKEARTPKTARGPASIKLKNRQRAIKSWETRRANLIATGMLREDGSKSPTLIKRRRKQALQAWITRREREAAAAAAAKRAERKAAPLLDHPCLTDGWKQPSLGYAGGFSFK
jgi:hypothetical protein